MDDISDAELNRRARDFERRHAERREARLKPARDKRAAKKAELVRLRDALVWIRQIADVNLEQDGKLRAQGARTLKRIADKCDEALK